MTRHALRLVLRLSVVLAAASVLAPIAPVRTAGQSAATLKASTLAPATVERLRAVAKRGLETTRAPGLSVAVAVDDELVWTEGVGVADVEHDTPVRADTVFRIASISKPITATAVMQLVERGRVSLDDPIQKHVPAFPPKGEQTITIRHLLTHTSGVRHYASDAEFNHRVSYPSVDAALAIFKDDPLLFAPGTKYSYSTYGYNLLAGVVERASGLTFEEYLRQHVWAPAGMTATRLEHPQEIVKGRARPYVRASGGQNGVRNAPFADLSIKWAGGGIISTAADLIRFHIAVNSGKLLKPQTLEQMYAPAKLADGSSTGYGLGWGTIVKPATTNGSTVTWIVHSGGATGGTTYLLRNPGGKLAVAVLTNIQNAPGIEDLALDFARTAGGGDASTRQP